MPAKPSPARKSGAALMLTVPSDLEVVLTRAFDAPRELVFKAFTDPTLIPQWWGRASSTTIVDKMDVRPIGVWRFVERARDGSEYAFNGVYREVAPTERLVYTFEYEGMPGQVLLATVTLEAHGGKTKLTDHALFQSVEDRDGMLQSGMEAGAAEGFERLAGLLETLRAPNKMNPPSPCGRELEGGEIHPHPNPLPSRARGD